LARNDVSDNRKADARLDARRAADRLGAAGRCCFATGAWARTPVAGVDVPCVDGVTLAGAEDPEEAEDGPL
jgi:hypothetical protein